MKKAKSPTQAPKASSSPENFSQSPPSIASMLDMFKNKSNNNESNKPTEHGNTSYGNMPKMPEIPVLPQSFYSKTEYMSVMSKHDQIVERIKRKHK